MRRRHYKVYYRVINLGKSRLNICMNWLLERLKEPSSWTWIVAVAAYFGYTLQPELADYIIAAAVSIIGAIQFIRKEKNGIDSKDISNLIETISKNSKEEEEDKSEES